MASTPSSLDTAQIERALDAFGLAGSRVASLAGGLIHESLSVRAGAVERVLQRISPIFAPGIHENIRAVTEHLHAKGFCTLRLLPTSTGKLFAELEDGSRWRLLSRVPGVSFDICASPAQARAASALVARFHSALDDLDHAVRPLGISLHDTQVHLLELRAALDAHREHRLYDAVAALAEEILRATDDLEPDDGLPRRIAHGDLKFNNVLFAGTSGAELCQALSLIDLDTVSRLPLCAELGDAWRSWCNRRGEDDAEAEFDLELFRGAAEGYLGALSIELSADERASLAHGLEWISLELAARFATDALRESYFGFDPARFATSGDHNLTRARGQLSLYRQARAERASVIRILTRAPGRPRAGP